MIICIKLRGSGEVFSIKIKNVHLKLILFGYSCSAEVNFIRLRGHGGINSLNYSFTTEVNFIKVRGQGEVYLITSHKNKTVKNSVRN